ncbi:hypothetical protein [Rhizobium sp. LC145]|uniref:hypothetical protein n=1 Tax=Rhizobium sp. LC145 TaxID=1120688 RepID=UPI0009E586F2|nr:hypothetical protein [Rhizobium sp. LC145]TKT66958.1 hypothetical protein FDR95_04580 [Rhizobiaceae bacterium LC148]
MTMDPYDNKPDLRTTPESPRRSMWGAWIAVIAVILVGAFIWSQMGNSPTDPATTSSTTPPPATSEPATPSPAPATPGAPPAGSPAPATPSTGGNTQP